VTTGGGPGRDRAGPGGQPAELEGSSQPAQVSAWNIANALTVLRIALVPVFGWLLLFDGGHETRYRILAASVFAFASLTDRIDGDIARARGIVTDFGKVSDPIADKALMGTALVGLSVLGELPWWVTLVVLVREVGITAMRFVVIRHGVMPASRGGKVKTVLQAVAIGLYVLPLAGAWHAAAEVVMAVAVVVTVVTGVDYVVRARTLRRTSPRARAKQARRAARLAAAGPAATAPTAAAPTAPTAAAPTAAASPGAAGSPAGEGTTAGPSAGAMARNAVPVDPSTASAPPVTPAAAGAADPVSAVDAVDAVDGMDGMDAVNAVDRRGQEPAT
jgi:CDP-diacylglycerol--glycerol-3-phosphate 3-phosphatidyltransferase